MTGNGLKSFILLAAMTAIFLVVGYAIGGSTGLLIAFCIAAAVNLFAWWNSDQVVLSVFRAKPVSRTSAPDLVGIVEDLAKRTGLPMPKVYVIQCNQPNAFATGRNPEHAAVAITTGLWKALTHEEVAGVIAHELAHIKNRDTLIMTITATLAGAIGMLAQFAMFSSLFGGNRDEEGGGPGIVGGLLISILAPLAAGLVQMAISRSREYEADRVGAQICGNPLWLASALTKLGHGAGRNYVAAERHPAMAHLFIVNPLHMRASDSLFSTHPSLRNRVARLEAMAQDS